jgi:O-antigen ligase
MLMLNARKAGKMLAIAVLIGIPAVIALTGSRGALIGLGVTLPVMFFVLSRVNVLVRLGVAGALFVSLYVAAPPGYWKQMETLLNPSKDYNSSDEYGRMGIAKRGVEYMLQYPVAGVGIANFPRAEGTLSPIARERLLAGEAVQWIAPHNTYVQVGAELGFPGLAVWLVLLWGGSIGLWQLRRQLPARWDHETADRRFLREATLFVPVSYVAFAVTSFFLSHAYTPPPYIIIAYHASLLVLIRRELRADRAGLKAAVTVPSASPARPLGRGGLTQGIAAR